MYDGLDMKRLRKARGRSLTEVCKDIDCSVSTLSKYENSVDDLRLGLVPQIAAALDVTFEDVIAAARQTMSNNADSPPSLTGEPDA